MNGSTNDAQVAATSSDSHKLLSTLEVPVRWRDLDAFNHVNNGTYLTYLEEARLKWLGSLPEPWFNPSISALIAAIHINYRRAIEWPAQLIVELYCDRLGNSSVTLGHRVVDAMDPGRLYSDGHSVMVWIAVADGRPTPLPKVIRAACQ